MKTTVFSVPRFFLLLRRSFAERKQVELIYWGMMLIAFGLLRNFVFGIGFLLFVAGVFYAARFLRDIHSPTRGVAYFMLPATQLEKITMAIVFTHFYYLAMALLCYVLGNLLGTVFNNLMASVPLVASGYLEMDEIFSYLPLRWVLFETNVSATTVFTTSTTLGSFTYFGVFAPIFLLLQSIFLLGGIYFKSNQTFKTFLAINLIQLLLLILFVLEMRVFAGDGASVGRMHPEEGAHLLSVVLSGLKCLAYLLMVFFWGVSYVRLTEKQR
jgi:hypothetical protein